MSLPVVAAADRLLRLEAALAVFAPVLGLLLPLVRLTLLLLVLAEVAAAISPLDLMEQRVRIQYLALLLAQVVVKEFLATTHRPEGLAVVEALAVVEVEPHPEALEILPVLVHHKATMAVLVHQLLPRRFLVLAEAEVLLLLVQMEVAVLVVVTVALEQHLLFLDFLRPMLAAAVAVLTKAVLLEQAAQVVVAPEL